MLARANVSAVAAARSGCSAGTVVHFRAAHHPSCAGAVVAETQCRATRAQRDCCSVQRILALGLRGSRVRTTSPRLGIGGLRRTRYPALDGVPLRATPLANCDLKGCRHLGLMPLWVRERDGRGRPSSVSAQRHLGVSSGSRVAVLAARSKRGRLRRSIPKNVR